MPTIVNFSMKKAFIVVLSLIAYGLIASPALADGTVTCQPIYGGGQTCTQTGNVAINKKVVDPITGVMVDNLGFNDNKFGPDGVVTFQLAVTNTGNSQINTVQVKDIFPQYVTFAAGVGNFDSNSKVLSFDVNNLNPNETRTFNIVGKVVSADQLPVSQGIVCVVNQGTAKDAASQGTPSIDTAQMCIQKNLPVPTTVVTQPGTTVVPTETKGGLKVFPPQKVFQAPSTGPEMLPLIALIPTGAIGAFLRRKTGGK